MFSLYFIWNSIVSLYFIWNSVVFNDSEVSYMYMHTNPNLHLFVCSHMILLNA